MESNGIRMRTGRQSANTQDIARCPGAGRRATCKNTGKCTLPLLLVAAVAFAGLAIACTPAQEPLSEMMVRSEIARCPEASYLDGREGTLKWNYTTGLELQAMIQMADQVGHDRKRVGQDDCRHSRLDTIRHSRLDRESIIGYVNTWYDAIIAEDGSIGGGYDAAKCNIDHICPGRTLLNLRKVSPKAKYDKAIENIFAQLQDMPRTEAGAFWHKKIYPNQVWLDGLYMAEPFYAQYAAETGRTELFDDIALQFKVAWEKTYDPVTGLPRHAWDESREMFWCDPGTGQSAHSWGRATGWYAMALAEVLDWFPAKHPERQNLLDILQQLLETLPRYADPKTAMWYQVLDAPGREGNYVEATCSAMFTYVYLKSARKGWLPDGTGIIPGQLYKRLVEAFIRTNEDGTISLVDCCAVAGLGGKQNRSGTYDYYIHETDRKSVV